MNDTVYVTDHSPAVFFAALADQIKAGFYADDSVEGFPHFDIVNEVKLTRTAKPSQRHDHGNVNEIHITAWHNTNLILDYQDAVLQGFELLPESVRLGEMHEPHYLAMRRKGVQAPVSPSKEEAAAESTPAPESIVKDVVEVPAGDVEPTKARKGGRPPKSKEL